METETETRGKWETYMGHGKGKALYQYDRQRAEECGTPRTNHALNTGQGIEASG